MLMISISCRISCWLAGSIPSSSVCALCLSWLGVFMAFIVLPQQPTRHFCGAGRSFACSITKSSEGFICTQMFCCVAVFYILHCAVTTFALSSSTLGICLSGSDVLQLFSSTLSCVTVPCKSNEDFPKSQTAIWDGDGWGANFKLRNQEVDWV